MNRDGIPSSRSALLLSLLFLVSIFSGPLSLSTPASAEQVTHFGNNGFPQSVNITFPSQGYDASTNLILAANGVASSASLNVHGWQGSLGSSPSTIGVDVGDPDFSEGRGGAFRSMIGDLDIDRDSLQVAMSQCSETIFGNERNGGPGSPGAGGPRPRRR